MFDDNRPYTFDRVVRMVLTAALLVVLFLMMRYLRDVLAPFVAAAVLAYFLNPVVVIFQRRLGLQRGPSVGLAFVTAGLIGLGVTLIFTYFTLEQVHLFDDQWQQLRVDASDWINETAKRTDETAESLTTQPAEEKTVLGLTELYDALKDFTAPTDESIGIRLKNLSKAVEGTYTAVVLDGAREFLKEDGNFNTLVSAAYQQLAIGGMTITNFTLQLFVIASLIIVILLYLFFLLLDFPNYQRDWRGFLPPAYRDGILEFAGEFDAVLRKYFRGQFIVAALTGMCFAIGFSIVGLPMAVPFGLFIGVLNIVPYMQMLAIPPAFALVVINYLSGNDDLLWSSILVALVFVVVQALQDMVLVPKIMGKAVGLSPVAILLGIFIWGKLLGFLGLLLAIPLTCLGIAYYRRFVLHLDDDEPVAAGAQPVTESATQAPPSTQKNKDKKKG